MTVIVGVLACTALGRVMPLFYYATSPPRPFHLIMWDRITWGPKIRPRRPYVILFNAGTRTRDRRWCWR